MSIWYSHRKKCFPGVAAKAAVYDIILYECNMIYYDVNQLV